VVSPARPGDADEVLMPPTHRRTLALTACGLLLAGCTMSADLDPVRPTPTPPPVYTAELKLPDDATTILDGDDDVTLAAVTSSALFVTAPVAVVAPSGDIDAQLRAASIAVALGAPLLLIDPDPVSDTEGAETPAPDAAPDAAPEAPEAEPGTEEPAPAPSGPSPNELALAELDRLGVLAVLTVGDVEVDSRTVLLPVPDDDAALAELIRVALPVTQLNAGDEVGWSDVGVVAALDRDAPQLLDVQLVPVATATDPAPSATESAAPTMTPRPEPTDPTSEPTDPTSEPTDGATADPEDASPLPLTTLATPVDGGLLLTTGDPIEVAAVATARAAGVPVLVVPSTHPGTRSEDIAVISELQPTSTLALGAAFGPADALEWKIATAATGVELAGGGQVHFPGRRYVALYGTPEYPALGILGEQDLPGSIARAQALAAEYQPYTDDVVVPAFEIIVTVAHRYAGDDGNYSTEFPAETFVPWVEAALEDGVYVVLDLQPGRTDFVTQAKLYEQLLLYPNVGLALDPEWRLKPNQVHLTQIGSVHIDEVNAVIDYLANLTRENHLPQKVLILHQFMLRMIEERERVDTSRDEVAVLIHADGQGSQGAKQATWANLHQNAPQGVWWGWKNFIDEDVPTLGPAETYQVSPPPHFVSYQ
jgi:hypothetical protein